MAVLLISCGTGFMAEIRVLGNGGLVAQSRVPPGPAFRHSFDVKIQANPEPETRMDKATQTELEAAAFRRLLDHLMHDRPDAQNIDMMNLAGFCRNCLSRWYQEAANARGIEMDKDAARDIIYGMPYDDWRAAHQTPADAQTQAAFKRNQTH
jgi:hypothetical protein